MSTQITWASVTWRIWLAIISAVYLTMGILVFWYQGIVQHPAEIWMVLWIPAGATGLGYVIADRPPLGMMYLALPTMLATGSVARGWSLIFEQAYVGASSWFLLTWLLVWGWNKTMAAPAHRAEMREG